MRLTPDEVQGIFTAIYLFLTPEQSVDLYLYGSRAQDELKGGDIDLLLLVDSEDLKTSLSEVKHLLLAEIKNNIGDQKIDLLIATKNDLKRDAFLKTIFHTSVKLQ